MNRESSRSHCVFTFVLETCETVPESPGLTRTTTSRFHLIDLAGSERLKSTKASGTLAEEAININKSLSALGTLSLLSILLTLTKIIIITTQTNR